MINPNLKDKSIDYLCGYNDALEIIGQQTIEMRQEAQDILSETLDRMEKDLAGAK